MNRRQETKQPWTCDSSQFISQAESSAARHLGLSGPARPARWGRGRGWGWQPINKKEKKKRQRTVLQAPNQPQSGTETPGAPRPANRGSMRDPGETRPARYARFCLAAPVRGGRTSCGSLLGHGEFHFSAAKQKAARGWKMDALILNCPPHPPPPPPPIPCTPPNNNRIFFHFFVFFL